MLLLPDPPIRKQDESWARNEEEKAETFATHLSKIFKPNPCEITLEEDNKLLSDNTTPAILDTPMRPYVIKEGRAVIRNLNPKKTPGYDLITNQTLQKLSEMGTEYINRLCNATFLDGASFHPNGEGIRRSQWKVAEIIMIQKSVKSAELAESYRPISLLSYRNYLRNTQGSV